MSEVSLQWREANVNEGCLEVPLDGEMPDGWSDTFATTAKLLGGGDWGEVRCKEAKVTVKDVSPGSEAKLRHFLESIVEQANATHRSEDPEPEQRQEEDEEEEDDEPAGPDAEMTEVFRSFGGGQREDGDEQAGETR
jgi:hypothetical protein